MEISRSLFDIQNDDVGRQQIVESLSNDVGIVTYRSGKLDVHHLSEGVNARICSSGALHVYFGLKNLTRRFSQLTHNCARVLLVLPATVFRPVVFQQDLERDHYVELRRAGW